MMKKLMNILVFISFISCQGQNKGETIFMTSHGDGYYSISNTFGNQLILTGYKNYKNMNDSIYFEKVLYFNEKDDFICLIGNIMGSKTSLLLALQKNKKKPFMYIEQIALIDSFSILKMHNYEFFNIRNTYTDVCLERKALLIYVLDQNKIFKSFEGIEKEEFFNLEKSLCVEGSSYLQIFKIGFDGNNIFLKANKEYTTGKNDHRKYLFINHEFK